MCDVIDVVDDNEPADERQYSVCEMCGNEKVRYGHVRWHAAISRELRVGRTCAEKISEDYVGPGRREAQQRHRAGRKARCFRAGGGSPTRATSSSTSSASTSSSSKRKACGGATASTNALAHEPTRRKTPRSLGPSTIFGKPGLGGPLLTTTAVRRAANSVPCAPVPRTGQPRLAGLSEVWCQGGLSAPSRG